MDDHDHLTKGVIKAEGLGDHVMLDYRLAVII